MLGHRSIGLAVVASCAFATAAWALDVAEIGSFHVGGRQVALDGMPTTELVFSAGAPPIKVDPNGQFEGQQFPIEAFDQFAKQGVPRWVSNDAPTIAACEAYFRKVCPCVVLAHSQGGNLVLTAGLRVPELIKGFVLVEASGAPDPEKVDLAAFKGVPHLFVWGDHLKDVQPWPRLTAIVAKYRDGVRAAGGSTDWIELPETGIKGNTHMMMMDRNSDQVAGVIQDWIGKRGLMR